MHELVAELLRRPVRVLVQVQSSKMSRCGRPNWTALKPRCYPDAARISPAAGENRGTYRVHASP